MTMTLISQTHLRNETASSTLGARGKERRELIHCHTLIRAVDGIQEHLEKEEAGSRGQDCSTNYIPGNYITGAKVHLGQFPSAAGGPDEERVLGRQGNQSPELCPKMET